MGSTIPINADIYACADASPTIDDALQWNRNRHAKNGDTWETQARGLVSMDKMRKPGEPATLEWMLDHLQTLKTRWLLSNPGCSEKTRDYYATRARKGAEEYLRYCRHPQAYEPPRLHTRKGAKDRYPSFKREADGTVVFRIPSGFSQEDIYRMFQVIAKQLADMGHPELKWEFGRDDPQ